MGGAVPSPRLSSSRHPHCGGLGRRRLPAHQGADLRDPPVGGAAGRPPDGRVRRRHRGLRLACGGRRRHRRHPRRARHEVPRSPRSAADRVGLAVPAGGEATLDANDLDALTITTIRTLTMDAVQKANSGHPGAPMGLAPAAYVLWGRIMRYDPEAPEWPDRDRFVLSAGHASM